MIFKGDFHIHSCLSPCAEITMVPGAVASALEKIGTEWVAITDHNSCGNVEVFEKVLGARGIKVIPGMEVQTVEEVHVLVYLKSIKVAVDFSNEIKGHLPKIENDPERFGYQLFVDENDNFVGMESAVLSTSTDLTIDNLWRMVKRYDGLFVYAHVDRMFGVVKQLGFIPNYPPFDAIEAVGTVNVNCTVLRSSDAHSLSQIKKPQMKVKADSRTFDEFRKALMRKDMWKF